MFGRVWGGWSVLVVVTCLTELATIGLLVFTHGFLLTRQVVPFNSTCQDFQNINNRNKLSTDSDASTSDQLRNSDKNTKHNLSNATDRSTGDQKDTASDTSTSDHHEGCWMEPAFKKVVILLVDALRYDFTTYNHSLKDEDALPYQNKLPVFDRYLRIMPEQTLLVPFIADAPTTTMQRLKGLTTGSLPTFIDASHNFASEEISEDNLIDQWVKHNKNITALGDDTWASLFPGRFQRSHLYPSFDVMDLHTVDTGIQSHLLEELGREDWQVLVAHFLGVDHCGHRYGPNHPQMALKLAEMNQVIQTVLDVCDSNTLVAVFGDHGMTQTGDHGGDSIQEVNAALFLHSPHLRLSPRVHSEPLDSFPDPAILPPQPVAQVDLVPTLALALGVPIPYSSLGRVIENVLATDNFSPDQTEGRQIQALSINVKQVQRYLNAYRDQGNEYPVEMWEELEFLNAKISTGNLSADERKQIYRQYLTLARLMCQEIWAKFNVPEILSGLFLIFVALVLMSLFVLSSPYILQDKIPVVQRLVALTLLVNSLYIASFYVSLAVITCVAGCLIICFIVIYRHVFTKDKLKLSPTGCVCISLTSFLFLGNFSNSYVVMENYVVAFILLSIVSIQALMIFLRHPSKGSGGSSSKGLKFNPSWVSLVCAGAVCALLVCIRCGSGFWKCREEQYWCVPSQVHTPLTGLPSDAHNFRYFTSLLSLGLLIYLPRRWLLRCGNLNGTRLSVLFTRYIPMICGLLVAGYWALQAVSTVHNININEQVILPRIIFILSFIYITMVFFLPLLIYEVNPSNKTNFIHNNSTALIPQLYRKLKERYNEQSNPKIPIVYGLATSISAPLLGVVGVVMMMVVLVAGDGLTPALLLLLVSAAAVLFIQSLSAWKSCLSMETIASPTICGVCAWFVLSVHGFYLTGHQPTFPTLHWGAAFVGSSAGSGGGGGGGDGGLGPNNSNINNLVPTLLVGLNTYSSMLVFGVALPLVILAPLALGVLLPYIRPTRFESDDARRGEFTLVEEPEMAWGALLSLSLSYILLHGTKVLSSALAGFLLRRHLMVWKIFAPHLIFESVGFLVSGGGVLVGLALTLRVLSSLTSWSLHLQKRT